MYIKVGDIVTILSGKDRFLVDENGNKTIKTGKVIKIFFKEQKVLVEGINIAIKHKNSSKDGEKGNIVREEMPIHISNVALIDPDKKIPTRVGYRYESGRKVRYSKKTGALIDLS
ncbi:MAG: 50S ribosomal protein L24 [Phytoplasma sp.]|uniref:50S ribosomal protein L24 n=1 Tax=Phytoplasma sp. TaxID=2155 RepID=UPI002B410A86|nr:50S ribosomal protein L24 [Phytoplasma sp.]WRH06906.1 MAG: 50S ribosomal protein L24 [Phytoplasma sp.]